MRTHLLFFLTVLIPVRAETLPEKKAKAFRQTDRKTRIASVAPTQPAQMNIKSSDPRVQSICADLVGREQPWSVAPHAKWLATPEAPLEIAYLLAHFDQLSADMKKHIPVSLAQAGAISAVPLILKALEDPQINSEIVLKLLLMGRYPDGDFGRRIAPKLLPLIANDYAISLMFRLDRNFALQSLTTEKYLGANSPISLQILKQATYGGDKIPRHLLDSLVTGWRNAPNLESSFHNHHVGVRALALYGADVALKEAESMVALHPDLSYYYSEFVLNAAGLSGLFEGLAEYALDLKKWAALPEPAKIYFAVQNLEFELFPGYPFDEVLPVAYAGNMDEGKAEGDLIPWVRKGYQDSGNTLGTQWLDWMLKPFGSNGPAADGKARTAQMQQMRPEYSEQIEALEDSWEDHREATLPNTKPPGAGWLVSRYATKHVDVLKPYVKK